jgi:hypothetical protein
VKALSLTQPWAWLVIHGGKDIENRRWNTKFRGPFLIHAAKRMHVLDDYAAAIGFADLVQPDLPIPEPDDLPRGGIVGIAELVDVLSPPLDGQLQSPSWRMLGQYGFVLRNVGSLPFQPCKGALGFWGSFELRDGKAVQL